MAKRPPSDPDRDLVLVTANIAEIVDLPYENQVAIIGRLVAEQGTFNRAAIQRILKEKAHERKAAKEEVQRASSRANIESVDWPAGVTVPPPYRVQVDGIYKDEEGLDAQGRPKTGSARIISTACAVVAKTKNIETGAIGAGLGFFYDNKYHVEYVSLETIASAAKFIALANRGVAVNTCNVTKVILYLDDQRAASLSTLVEVRTTSRGGWGRDGDHWHFALGKLVIRPSGDGTIEREHQGNERQVVEAIFESGNYIAWTRAIHWLKKFKIPLFMLGAGFAAPLLELVGVSNFTVHSWDHSTEGKTACLQGVLSINGKPTHTGLLMTWRKTENGMEVRAKAFNSLVTPADDNSQAFSGREMGEAVYMIGNGQGKQRANQSGDGRAVATFNTIMVSTGEKPISSATSLAGQEVRAIEIPGSPFGGKNAELGREVQEFKETVCKNFGHAGLRYATELVAIANDTAKHEELRREFQEIRRALSEKITDPFLLRTVDYFAVIKLGLRLAQRFLPEIELADTEIDDAVCFVLGKQGEHLKVGNNIDVKAMQYIWDAILSEPYRFHDNRPFSSTPPEDLGPGGETFHSRTDREMWGAKIRRKNPKTDKSEDGYAFLPAKLNALLERGGFSPKACCDFFKAKEWVWLDKGGQLWSFKLEAQTRRGYVFYAEKARELGILSEAVDSEDDKAEKGNECGGAHGDQSPW